MLLLSSFHSAGIEGKGQLQLGALCCCVQRRMILRAEEKQRRRENRGCLAVDVARINQDKSLEFSNPQPRTGAIATVSSLEVWRVTLHTPLSQWHCLRARIHGPWNHGSIRQRLWSGHVHLLATMDDDCDQLGWPYVVPGD